jgi:hypothetical protein
VVQQLLDILPAVWVAAPGVVVSQPINQANLRVASQDGRNINDWNALNVDGGDNLERAQY